MTKSLRLSEKWFRFGLWVVAFVFAGFLVGLGSTVVKNLPKVEQTYKTEDFINKTLANQARDEIKASQNKISDLNEQLDRATLNYATAQTNYKAAHDSFTSWIATRRATDRADQDAALIARNRDLDKLKNTQSQVFGQLEKIRQNQLEENQQKSHWQTRLNELTKDANESLHVQQLKQELRVFLYRLALTLPLLVISGWLLAKKRKSTYWPFVWGFVLFALFTFFIELVPYLPSYGGYVRYTVGIIVTVLVGQQVIVALNHYLEKQKLTEQLPDQQRREELSYDVALSRMAQSVCPSCERALDLKNTAIDFCPHCGICLFKPCGQCATRKNAFTKFCHSCGTSSSDRAVNATS